VHFVEDEVVVLVVKAYIISHRDTLLLCIPPHLVHEGCDCLLLKPLLLDVLGLGNELAMTFGPHLELALLKLNIEVIVLDHFLLNCPQNDVRVSK
jgi:hypothetical protein